MNWTSRSPDETHRLGMRLARQLQPQDVAALIGEIGSGKTIFVQGIAQGLGVPPRAVASPSFVLIREYRGRIPLYHADLYRLERSIQAATVGLEEYYEQGGITVVEWANRVPGILPVEYLEIQFTVVDPNTRRLLLIPHGAGYEKRTW